MSQLSDVLKAIGPNASIIFAAWIFMGFLQQRYDGAINRFRDAVREYRSAAEGERASNLERQVLSYRRRCRLMIRATLIGLLAAILLISSLMFGVIDALKPDIAAVTVCGIATATGGFGLVIVAAVLVILEGRIVSQQVDEELQDVPEFASHFKP